ncbi:MAG: hypothetical protein WAT39_15835 [Planctomycetota bacterium]
MKGVKHREDHGIFPDPVRARVQVADGGDLERWGTRLLTATDLAAVFENG